MKAALLYGIRDLRLVELPRPEVGPHDVLLRVRACGVCPTDLRKFNTIDGGRLQLPMNLGHEFVGTVVEAGAAVEPVVPGTRLMGLGYAGYAEYALLRMDEWPGAGRPQPVPIPAGVSDVAATFAEPLADCVHAVVEQAALQPGQTIAIIGGGTMGQLLQMTAKAAGGRTIVSEPDPGRREMALALGADAVVDPVAEKLPEAIRRFTGGELAHATILTIGVPELVQAALETVRTRGRVVLFGGFPRPTKVEVDPNLIHYEEIMLLGTEWVGAGPYWDVSLFHQALERIANGAVPVERLISASYPLARIQEAFAAAARMDTYKVIVTMEESDS